MKTTELKILIKEAVREAIQEELKDILLEAVRAPKIPVGVVPVQGSEPTDDTVQTVVLGAIPVQASVPAVSPVQLSPNILPRQLIVEVLETDPKAENTAFA